MAGIKTRASAKSLVTTNLPTGTGAIFAADHRDVENAILDTAALYGEAEIRVVNITTTSPPGGPSDRQAYVVASGATGAWAGQDGNIATWDAQISPAAWVFTAPGDGLPIYDLSDNRRYRYDGGVSPAVWRAVSRYDIAVPIGSTPSAGEIMARHTMVVDVHFPADFSGSQGTPPDTNPDANFAATVNKVDKSTSPTTTTAIGTVTISTAGAYTFATTGNAAQEVAAGLELQVVAPNTSPAEASIANFSFTFKATAEDY